MKRVFAGFYKRYDGTPIYVVDVLKDIDTGEEIVVCKYDSISFAFLCLVLRNFIDIQRVMVDFHSKKYNKTKK